MQTITIERLGQQGDGISGEGVLVPFSLPKEQVRGVITDNRMAAPERLTESNHRVEPVCAHYAQCGGCSVQHASDEFLADWKREIVARALGAQGLTTEIHATATTPPASRRRAVFSGRRTRKTTVVGFHQRGSQQSFNLTECPLILPELVLALPACHVLVGAGASRKGEIRLSVTHSAAGPDIAVTQAKPLDGPLRQVLAGLVAQHGIARLDWNHEPVATRQPPVQHFGDVEVGMPAGAFMQATAFGEATLVDAMQKAVGGAKRVVDLFSGCGTFTLPLARKAEMHAVEGEAAMLAALDKCWRFAKGLKPVSTETRDLFARPLVPLELNRFDAVVIDPPRAGAKAQVEELVAATVPVIGAVSCNPVTFARDARILVDGGFRLDWVQPVDQFRWSGHVELAARFSR